MFLRQHVLRPDAVYLLAGDEVVVTKAGQHTYGLERGFARLYGTPVPGLAFFTLALVRLQHRRSCPSRVEQVVRRAAEQAARTAKAEAKKPTPATVQRRPGRPQGRQPPPRADVPLTPELWRITGMLDTLLKRIAGFLPLTYVRLDGHFGHHNARQRARQSHRQLISKRRCDAALALSYSGPDAGRGPPRTSGRKLDDHHLPEQYLKEPTLAGPIHTRVYQAQLRHQEFAHPLTVVIIVKPNLPTLAQAPASLFSSNLTLAYASLVDDSGLRCQSECNCRDAQQSWGLEDCMNVTPMGVTNAANRSWFMVHVAYRLQADGRPRDPDSSILDLKADCRGDPSGEETIQRLPEKPEPVLCGQILHQGARLGRMHVSQPSFSFS